MSETLKHRKIEKILAYMREMAVNLTGKDESAGFQISALIHMLANRSENVFHPKEGEDELSGPRLGLLARLLEQEHHGNTCGITPTEFSQNQHVSRNTISALLRGLEDQGYIERRLDPEDRRLFRIYLTEKGREIVKKRAPERITRANQMVSGLTPDEQAQLIHLLSKLFDSIQSHCSEHEQTAGMGDQESVERK
jgi:DNA-binding MarR family transcriptional regulator